MDKGWSIVSTFFESLSGDRCSNCFLLKLFLAMPIYLLGMKEKTPHRNK
jgi:hypothetical protein